MFTDAVHHRWKSGEWVNKKTKEVRPGQFLYNRENDTFTICLCRAGKGTRSIKRFLASDLSFDAWEYRSC